MGGVFLCVPWKRVVCTMPSIAQKAGAKKLKTMENAAVFRRKITFKEWEHRVLRLKIEEKRIAIKCIQRCKVDTRFKYYQLHRNRLNP